ncbi:ATP-binding protein [Rhizobium laguerreae]|uniref:NACHT domain-containing protein n=1 Tax=Rhizobium laguerreae TaxID=1076926 RepID=A0A6N9ZB52_9HYPH|nr:ATP-binding protein [Rhizobium laguerreae]NEH90279.1 hypothetical protein [Rhizobium laguerreae]
MADSTIRIDTVRASRAGHTFHERWTARRILQLVFPKDSLFAVAVEGISPEEPSSPGKAAEEVADLVLYYGKGATFASCDRLETAQFKYQVDPAPETASYLKKTIEKFGDTLKGYEEQHSASEVDAKLSFSFVTNTAFAEPLWKAIEALKAGLDRPDDEAGRQFGYLDNLCRTTGVSSHRLFAMTEFRASEQNLPALSGALKRTLTDWSAGSDSTARAKLHGLKELVIGKAGPSGQSNNLIKKEDVLDALGCEPEDLFPAGTRFVPVGEVVERSQLGTVVDLVKSSSLPLFIHADGGVGKTVFIQSLASSLVGDFEVVVFDCFGGGSYRSEDQARHLPKVGLIQIVNELASRGLCDPLLPGDGDRIALTKAARKRLGQAANAVKEQSAKGGLLLILDAADNAQLEADNRKDDSFPKLLLASLDSEPIDGVKLVLTARPHRIAGVTGRSRVMPFELVPFTDEEARQFLIARRETLSDVEFASAMARSRGNARVLAYLLETWEQNVLGNTSADEITVEEIIAQRCQKIFDDLHVAGWSERDVREFFAGISLLPPPIPLDELANALGWSDSQVRSAASDLAPMLEVSSHGAIFRDEPTETYIHETYSKSADAQQAIAQRLQESQSRSAYAAEALPHFLVVINDSDRAFALADSQDFPESVQSDFGKRRLILARLDAAFRLAVKSGNLDRVLELTMRLAQVASANAKGDQFVRRSAALAAMLGGRDAYRRLFNDRSGWRGARSARLTVANCFADEADEAALQASRTIGWINWHVEQREDDQPNPDGPTASDFAAVIFQAVTEGQYEVADRNLARWSLGFALSVSKEVVELVQWLDRYNGRSELEKLARFAASKTCQSFALKIALITASTRLPKTDVVAIARSTVAPSAEKITEDDNLLEGRREGESDVTRATIAALLDGSQASAHRILAASPLIRPTGYDYSERYGRSRAWPPLFRVCVGAWVQGRRLERHDLLPREVKVTKLAKAIASREALIDFLGKVEAPRGDQGTSKRGRRKHAPRYDESERRAICAGIEVVLTLVRPLEKAFLEGQGISSQHLEDFTTLWSSHLHTGHPRSDEPKDLLSRAVGLGIARLLLRHADEISITDAERFVELISNASFTTEQKTEILGLLAERPALSDLAGRFARHVADHIKSDDYIEQRGESYAGLASSLVPMSMHEAGEYYRQGLAELDQLGGNDHDQIYSLLHYAAQQRGGVVRAELGHRLMNLCQTIASNEPSKFGWKLFSRAAAASIGLPAVNKLLRWDDQDVADFSYGLPQLVCYLAKSGVLDPRRAAFLLSICDDQGWHEWRFGDGLADLLTVADPPDRRMIFVTIFEKLKEQHTEAGWPSVWEGILDVDSSYPGLMTDDERQALNVLKSEALRKRDEYNSQNSTYDLRPAKAQLEEAEVAATDPIEDLVATCDPTSPVAIDEALKEIREHALPYPSIPDFLAKLRAKCPYDQRLAFLMAICEATDFEFDAAVDLIIASIKEWSDSTAHVTARVKEVIKHLFEFKGSELFDLRYSSLTRYVSLLAELCGDRHFVMNLVLETIAHERPELGGDEWLQVATSLCELSTPQASLEALETLLSGPSLRIADDIGEGPFREEFRTADDQPALIAGIVWHLLGDEDGFIRWDLGRAIESLCDLKLWDEIGVLVDGFDRTQTDALASPDAKLSFQNSQQWLLMGLSRATLLEGSGLDFLQSKLKALVKRTDVHVVHKLHLLRCLEHLVGVSHTDPELEAIRTSITIPPHGYVEATYWPAPVESQSGFRFDYEFDKTEISSLAMLFGLSKGEAIDAVAAEIKRRWPEATSLKYFTGGDRYRRDSDERYEFYREHIQRHALISAATTLVGLRPVADHSYDDETNTSWASWLRDYDVTFDDGSWLADRKDVPPPAAHLSLLGNRKGQQETLQDQATLLAKIGLADVSSEALVPIQGHWISPDGVDVTIVSALAAPRGVIRECERFSKRKNHDFWLPQYWDGGYYERRNRQTSPFEPFVWSPEAYSLGIDTGDEIAARGAAARPRLGIEITKSLGLMSEKYSGEWRAQEGSLALKSLVWGQWKPTEEDYRTHSRAEGEILFADPLWLDATMSKLRRRFVYSITFSKYPSSRKYSERTGAKAVFVGLRTAGCRLRIWHAKKASSF